MIVDDQYQYAEAALLSRSRAVLAHFRMVNGTTAAEAVTAALLADAKAKKAAANALAQHSDDVLRHIYFELDYALGSKGSVEVTLPLGTVAKSADFGSIEIARQLYVLDAGRAGLHHLESTRRDAHGPNLERLHDRIARKTKRLACRRIGLPAAITLYEEDEKQLLRFPPFAPAGGVTLQCSASRTGADRFCAASGAQIDAMADQLIEGMRILWTHREEIARSSAAIRCAAEAGILKDFGEKTDVALAGIAVERDPIFPDRLPFFELEFVAPDESLRMGRVSQCLPRHTDIAQGLSPGLMAEDRLARRQELLAKGADGEIDDLALAVARIAPDGIAAVLKSLSTEQQTRVVIPMRDGPLYASLFWCDGVIKVDVGHAGRLYVYANTVELPEARLPDTVAAALVGKRLDAVAELPFCCPSPIAEVRQSNVNGLQLKLDVGRWLVDTRGGTVWQHAA